MLRDVPHKRSPLADSRASECGTHRAEGVNEQVSRRSPGSAYCLIAKNENNRLEVLATGLAGGAEAMPIFSHDEEAEMFLQLGDFMRDGWRVRKSSAGELVSVLCGPCASVKRVALDPLPEMVLERTVGLVSLSRERFVELVLSRERSLERRKG